MSIVRDMLGSARRTDIERWARSLAHGVPMPNGDTLCRVLGEYMFVVTLEDHSVAPHLVLNGYWETWVTMCLAKRVKPGWHCLDVGANFGYYTVLLADLVGEAGKVEAWEPQQACARALVDTLRLNGLDRGRVSIVLAAAGTAAGRAKLVRPRAGDFASAALEPVAPMNILELGVTDEKRPETHELCRVQPLSATLFERVDFVKLDVEGMEPEAWASLGEKLPHAALIEWTPTRYASPTAFLVTLREQGYTIGRVNSAGDVDPTGDELLGVAGSEMLWVERPA